MRQVTNSFGRVYAADNKVFEKKQDAHKEYQSQLAKIAMELNRAEARSIAEFRKKVGLTTFENDAKIIHEKIMEAVIILAACHEMGKTQSVIDEAALKVANTRIMYDSICKRIFKICLKHGLKSEHMK